MKPDPAWSSLSSLKLHQFVPTDRLQLSARELHATAGSIDGALSLITGWLSSTRRPDVVHIDAYTAGLVLSRDLLAVTVAAADARQLRVLRQLGSFELDIRWGDRSYRGPANALNW